MIGRLNQYDERFTVVRRVGFMFFSVALLACVFLFSVAPYLQAAVDTPPQPLIRQAVNENARVALKGNTRPEANATNDRGPVADDFPMEHMLLQLQRSPEQEQALEQFIDQLHNPASPNFHHWLTAQEFGERFGLAQEDLNAITAWLQRTAFRSTWSIPAAW